MNRRTVLPETRPGAAPDLMLLGVILLLTGGGLAVLFSASYFRAETLFKDPLFFLKKQVLWVALGAGAAAVLARLDLEYLRKATPAILGLSFASMLLCFVPGLAPEFLGARRWLVLFGWSFQPAESAKFALVLYLAYILSKKEDNLADLVNTVAPPFLVVTAFSVLVYLQNDFSTFLFFLALGLLMLFIAGVRLRYFVAAGLAGLPIAVILLFTKEHRVRRLISFIEPDRDPGGSGFQVLSSKLSLASGGLWGIGIGQGTRKLGGLPEAHSDFIFSVLGEEFGYLGVLLVIGLFVVFAWRGYQVALHSSDSFSFFLAFGMTSCIFFQAVLNIGVVSGIIPATGVTLPFFSSGGSSILVTLAMCGVLLNLSAGMHRSV